MVPIATHAAQSSPTPEPSPQPQSPAPPAVVVNRTRPAVGSVPGMPVFSNAPTPAEITRARVFEEPLLPVGNDAPSAAENRELASLLTAYLSAGVSDGTQALEIFALGRSNSPWRAALLTDLGLVWRRTGHFSKAYNAWQLAWSMTKDLADRNGHAVGDRAIAELVGLNARLGRYDALAEIFEEVDGREIHGAAAQKISDARQALWIMNNRPQDAFRCGPLALDAVLAVGQPNYTTPTAIKVCPSTKRGTSLAQMRDLAQEVGASMQIAFRPRGAAVVIPALVHWNVGHFAALIDRQGDKYLVRDPTFGDELWMTQAALDEEASGYVLIRRQSLAARWRAVPDAEGSEIWGKGLFAGTDATDGSDTDRRRPCACGMAVVSLGKLLANLIVQDTPLWYIPPKGYPVQFELSYNQRDILQPQTFSYANLGTRWTFTWLSYITDDPTNPNASINVYVPGGTGETASGFNASTNSYAPTTRQVALITRTSASPIQYERQMEDGSVFVYGQPDGAATFPRNVFMTAWRDPQGNALTFTYDANLRLVAVTDALGQVTTLAYTNADPLKITAVTDPFGRTATLTYDANGRLASITDIIGLTSSFTYGSSDVIRTVTTPYGTTTVTWGEADLKRWVEYADPLGGRERVEYGGHGNYPSDPLPTGMPAQQQDSTRNTSYWDKRAMATAPGDPASATDYFWALSRSGVAIAANVPLSIKRPLENRVFYSYVGGGSDNEGTLRRIAAIGRVLDDGTSQVWKYAYNSRARLTQRIDPLGRETDYVYDATGLDLLQVKQKRGGTFDILETRTYNNQHLPLTITDAAGQTTTYTYNPAGQVLTTTNAKSETTTYAYDGYGRLVSETGPFPGATTTYGYDTYGRVNTVTDSEGYAVTAAYDAADRVVQLSYPDGTTEQTTFDRLDLHQQRDRLGRITTYTYDVNRRLTATRDPLGRIVAQEWCVCGTLQAIVDGNGVRTQWDYDLEGRQTRQTRADGSQTQYAYEIATSRLKQVTDPKGQTTTYTYAVDNALLQTVYANATISTPSVSFTYDTIYRRLSTMVDGTGTTTYSYHPTASGQLGAGKRSAVDGPLTNDTITYAYDELGRMTSREINGVAETTGYDALGRISGQTNSLGTFGYTYVGATGRLAGITYPNGQSTSYAYFGHSNDDRVQTIHHKYPNAASLMKFDYTYDAVGNIFTWQQQVDTADPTILKYGYDLADELVGATKWTTVGTPAILKRYAYAYDRAGNRTSEQIDDSLTGATNDNMNRLVSQQATGGMLFAGVLSEPATATVAGKPVTLNPDNSFSATVAVANGTNTIPIVATDPSGNARTNQYQLTSSGPTTTLTYDANGNLVGDGTRTFEWDARDQLTAISFGAHRSEFTYDGEQRRVRVVEKENGVIGSDHRYLWCGLTLCQELDNSGQTPTLSFFREGYSEGVVPYYYVSDHLGSIVALTDGAGSIRARYDYDPYGRQTKVTGDKDAEFGFTGHHIHRITGIDLTLHRAYDSSLGRWFSEDPSGFSEGTNLYAYVQNKPIGALDPLGLQSVGSGAPPDTGVPPGCTSSGWHVSKIQNTNSIVRNIWTLIDSREINVPVPLPSGEVQTATLGCGCTWKKTSVVALNITVKFWVRTITCCGQSRMQGPVTSVEKLPYESPTIGGQQVYRESPATIEGCQNDCKLNPPPEH